MSASRLALDSPARFYRSGPDGSLAQPQERLQDLDLRALDSRVV
jgi:hypothetical protein